MNRKLICTAAALVMLAAMTGCGGDPVSTADSAAPAATTAASPAETTLSAEQTAAPAAETDAVPTGADVQTGGVSFTYSANGTDIPISAEADPIVAALGTPADTFEAPSCAFEGTSYTYTYPGFTVETYPDPTDHVTNRIYAVTLTDDTVATKEGARVGNTYDEVRALCGEPDQETLAFMVYKTDGAALQFFLENDVVTSVVYTYAA